MKKFLRKFHKTRLAINLLSIQFQIWSLQRVLDNIERDLAAARKMHEFVKEFLDDCSIKRKIARLETDKAIDTETMSIYRKRFAQVRNELVA